MSPCNELRDLCEQKAPSVGYLVPDKKDTPPVSSVKCSLMMVASICTQDSVEFSPAVAAVVSAPNSELWELQRRRTKLRGAVNSVEHGKQCCYSALNQIFYCSSGGAVARRKYPST
jgi:hypothetical protein